ncbi:MAG: hypothetical protein PSX36_00630 [bacterium]|nr:hypothetical protein [bacterium]
MKKIVYTLSCVAFCSVLAQAQTKEAAPRQGSEYPKEQAGNANSANTEAAPRQGSEYPKQQAVNPDGTAPNSSRSEVATPPSTDPQPVKSRHAITEKGVPTTKNKDVNSEKTTPPANSGAVKPQGRE